MSQVYRARHGLRSYQPVRVPAREIGIPRDPFGRNAVIVTLASLAILDGFLAILIGLR